MDGKSKYGLLWFSRMNEKDEHLKNQGKICAHDHTYIADIYIFFLVEYDDNN